MNFNITSWDIGLYFFLKTLSHLKQGHPVSVKHDA